ncbi:MAG: hypothetical protein M3Y56_00665 [Armatimonadota bacterium]|nr:hypothetical protein [Armatimonadota bacterium]
MSATRYTSAEIVARGEEIYARDLQAEVEQEHRGEFLVVDIETGRYELDADEVAALKRAVEQSPGPNHYIKRIGYSSAHGIGWS